MLFVLACVPPASDDTGSPPEPVDPTADWVPGDGPLVVVSGMAFEFGPAEGSLAGGRVYAAEAPELQGVVAEDGTFSLDVPSGAPLSFVLEAEGFTTIQSATIDLGEGVTDLGFQVPTPTMVELLAGASDVDLEDTLCQVAATVSSVASPPYGGAGVGEPGAVVAIAEGLPDGATGPIYFDYLSDSLILPDPTLTETTIDGGVLFANLPTGEYTLVATKDGVAFTDAVVRCRPGVIANAAPPHGIEAY